MIEKTVKLECIADTYIDDQNPAMNFGNNPTLWLYGWYGENDPSRSVWPVMRFEDLPSDFSWSNFISAELGLYITSFSPSDSRRIHFYKLGGDWDENTLTWNNQPSVTYITETEIYVDHTGLYTFVFDQSSLQQTVLNNKPQFMIHCNWYSDQFRSEIASRTHTTLSYRPYLELTYSAPGCILNGTPYAVGETACIDYDLYECTQSEEWVLQESNSPSCGYVPPVCIEGETRCSGYDLQQCTENAWVTVETNSASCGYVPDCTCDSWMPGECISETHRRITRTCVPAGCAAEVLDVFDSSCAVEPEPSILPLIVLGGCALLGAVMLVKK